MLFKWPPQHAGMIGTARRMHRRPWICRHALLGKIAMATALQTLSEVAHMLLPSAQDRKVSTLTWPPLAVASRYTSSLGVLLLSQRKLLIFIDVNSIFWGFGVCAATVYPTRYACPFRVA